MTPNHARTCENSNAARVVGGTTQMADTRPTKVSLLRACHLCLLGIFAPKSLIVEEDKEQLKQLSQASERELSAMVLCRAFWWSLILVILSCVLGFGAGRLIGCYLAPVSPRFIIVMQGVGAMLLLWGTLFVRGWDVQTIGGVSLVERVNLWIYRALYCIGTAVFIFSLSLP